MSWPAGAQEGFRARAPATITVHKHYVGLVVAEPLALHQSQGWVLPPQSQGCCPRMRDKASVGAPAAGRSPLPL